MGLNNIRITDIQPSQFYISEAKIRQIKTWFSADDLSNFEPVPIRCLDGRIIFTDGHTRALVAYMSGIYRIPFVWDEDELDEDAYRICVKACQKRNIYGIADLAGRILPECEYDRKWNDWCTVLLEVLELQRV